MKKIIYSSLGVLAAVLFLFGLYGQANKVEGSTVVGNDYNATNTDPVGWTPGIGKQFKACTSICPGSLGSVVITFSSTLGSLKIYDATTTSVLLRDASQSTSTITVANFPTLTAGTYTFDVDIKRGIVIEVGGLGASSTITGR